MLLELCDYKYIVRYIVCAYFYYGSSEAVYISLINNYKNSVDIMFLIAICDVNFLNKQLNLRVIRTCNI